MWDVLQVFHKEIEDVKESKIIEEYEFFYIESKEFVASIQMRFYQIVYKLENPSKTNSN